MIIINAKIHTMDGGKFFENGFILINNGKIEYVGDMQGVPHGRDEVIDAKGGCAVPGFIDAHCHLGLFEDSMEGADANEDTSPVTPHLRAIDAINPFDGYFKEARQGGVTTAVVSPGSTNVIGGQAAAIKTYGDCIDDMIIKAPCAIKCALGENPKSAYGKKGQAPLTRMANAAMLRQQLLKAKTLIERHGGTAWDGADLQTLAMIPLIKGEIPLHIHAHRADDILTAIRIGKEFGVDVKIIHGTQGYKITKRLAEEKIDVMAGPIICVRSKPELEGLHPQNAVLLQNAGVRVAIISDHPELPVNYLLLSAQLAAKEGMSAHSALKAITCDAANILGIQDRVGKIASGADADILIFDAHPLCFDAKLLLTIINGRQCLH